MRINKFSQKQLDVLKFGFSDDRSIVCDGAVRSGKTLAMSLGFVVWAMEKYNGTNFAICGKTVQSTERNVINPLRSVEGLPYKMDYKISTKIMTVTCGRKQNYFYIFGGKDESSYALIQGITLAGILFDEVALMPKSFVDQAIARTLTYDNAKLWYNCNPESPTHWFYEEHFEREVEDEAHKHFLMTDNPLMDSDKIKKAEKSFSGVFYRRYILGEWVRAEGAIYPTVIEHPEMFVVDGISEQLPIVSIGIDYGASKSKTSFKATGFSYNFQTVYALDEMDSLGVVSPDEIYEAFIKFYQRVVGKHGKCQFVYADYGALGQIITDGLSDHCRRAGFPVIIRDCIKGQIFERIELTNNLMAMGRLKISKQCPNLMRAFQDAVWDDKHDNTRLDNGTSDIDSLDAFEYSIFPFYDRLR